MAKKKNPGCLSSLFLIGAALLLFALVVVILPYEIEKANPQPSPQAAPAVADVDGTPDTDQQYMDWPHKAFYSARKRSQIRIVAPAEATDEEISRAAEIISERKVLGRPSYVDVFTDETALSGWDGTGGVEEGHRAHWIARVLVDDGKVRNFSRDFF